MEVSMRMWPSSAAMGTRSACGVGVGFVGGREGGESEGGVVGWRELADMKPKFATGFLGGSFGWGVCWRDFKESRMEVLES